MKKAMIIAAAAVLVLSCAACGPGDVPVSGTNSSASSAASAASSAAPSQAASSAVSVNPAKYSDNLKGLLNYMGDSHYIEGSGVELEYELIGAKGGRRYTKTISKNSTETIELYEYDLKSPNATAKKILDEVKQSNSFTLFEKKIPACLSSNGKYLMVYKDSANGSTVSSRQKEIIEKFKAYKA